jgi:hypothetical protein
MRFAPFFLPPPLGNARIQAAGLVQMEESCGVLVDHVVVGKCAVGIRKLALKERST